MRVVPIVPGDRCIGELSDIFAAEWPHWAATISRAQLEASFACGADGELPVVLVAKQGPRTLGTVALRPWFGDEPMAETPWVRGLYVPPEHRGRGVDRLLLRAVEDEARGRGFEALYAGTTSIERLAVRRGWRVFRRFEREGEEMAWMVKKLSASERPSPSPRGG